MSDHVVTVNLPDSVFDRLRQIAEATAQPVGVVVVRQLEASVTNPELTNLPDDEQQELVAFNLLSDDTLQGIMREQMPLSVQAYMQTLMDQNTAGTLSPSAHADLIALVERSNRLMLRKAWAADVLMKRGKRVTGDDFSAA